MKNEDKKILFPNASNPLDISKINTLFIASGSCSGWSNGIFTLTANILDFLRENNRKQKKNLIICDTHLLFDSYINSKLAIPIQKEFKLDLLESMIKKSLAGSEHIFLLIAEIIYLIPNGQFEQLSELVKKYKGNPRAHFIFTTNRLTRNNYPELDTLIKASDCVIFFYTVAIRSDTQFYLGQDCGDAFNKIGDMVIKLGDRIIKAHGNKFEEEDLAKYLKLQLR